MKSKKPGAVRLADQVSYQKDSIVSRHIIKRGAGNITLFAFDVGQNLSEHKAPFDAAIHVIDGEAEIRISGEPFILKEGEMIIMPANRAHSVKALKKFKMLLTMIKA
ncbi:MAG: cupin domain-containing protein [Candidatus Aenigmarchaeota archaeon]|nr:cupin domain-containing protein [Candidatus Aenigmarchaeota archaeon]